MPGRKVFADSIIPLPPQDGLAPNGLLQHGIGPRHNDDRMDVLFSLELPRPRRRNSRVALPAARSCRPRSWPH